MDLWNNYDILGVANVAFLENFRVFRNAWYTINWEYGTMYRVQSNYARQFSFAQKICSKQVLSTCARFYPAGSFVLTESPVAIRFVRWITDFLSRNIIYLKPIITNRGGTYEDIGNPIHTARSTFKEKGIDRSVIISEK